MDSPPLIDSYSYTLGMLSVYIRQVKNGAKPVAQIVVREEEFESIRQEIRKEHLSCESKMEGDHHRSVYIFEFAHLRPVVIHLFLGLPLHPNDMQKVRAHAEGKLFGYSESEIAGFIENMEHAEAINDKE